MKKTCVLAALVFGFSLYSCSKNNVKHSAIVLSSLSLEDIYINSAFPDANWNSMQSIIAAAWTYGGTPGVGVTLFKVDFSIIPKDAELLSATLNFYHDPISSHVGHSTRGGSNIALLQRITSSWEPESVNWNSQPSSTQKGQILLAESASSSENYLDINVFEIVSDFMETPNESFGLLLRPVIETPYRSLVFASVDHPMSELHPTFTLSFLTSSNVNGITQP